MKNKLNRRRFLKAMGGLAAAAATSRMGHAASGRDRQPNIIFIYADDLDFDELSVYDHTDFPCHTGAWKAGHYKGNPWAAYRDTRMLTPHIQSIADDGATLDRFYVSTSICCPSRYSLLTGRFASRSPGFCRRYEPGTHANIGWGTPIDADETNVAKELKKQGYATGMVGKWHNGGPRSGKVRGVPADADPTDAKVARKVRKAYENIVSHIRDNMGFDFVERIYNGNKEGIGLPEALRVHNLEWITEGALKFIDQNHRDPFFLYMPLTVPHAQYSPNWLNADPKATPAGMLDKAPDVQPSRESIFERLKKAGIHRRNAPATWIDDSVGAILGKLQDLGLSENTMVVFASDHQSRGKYACYEGARVPCVIRWPGHIPAGSRTDALCANLDMAATCIEMAGGTPPADMNRDGRSLLPLLTEGETPSDWRDALLLEVSNIRAVVTNRWKYIANRPPEEMMKKMEAEARRLKSTDKLRRVGWSGRENWMEQQPGVAYANNRWFADYFDRDQLYALHADVFEQNNLAGRDRHADVLEDMKNRLSELLKPLPHTFGEFKAS